jgi:hypothetical protein
MVTQEIFDTVARHLFKQGHPAIAMRRYKAEDFATEPKEECVYRAPNGDKCAAGVIIPDDLYVPEMEGKAIYAALNECSHTPPRWMIDNLPLMEALQEVHDAPPNWKTDAKMKHELWEVADRFGLDPAVLDGLSFNRGDAA